VERTRLFRRGKLFKRLRQFAYVGSHLLSHLRCALTVRRSGFASDNLISLKYLGDHLALSLTTSERREALMGHYAALPELLNGVGSGRLSEGIAVWRRDVGIGQPPLSITLEPSHLAPMEGELQLRFSHQQDLYVLTFMIAPGRVFGAACERVLFVGGVQGIFGARREMRAASKLNDEISPAAMLILAVQAIGKAVQAGEIIAIAEDDHISMGYSPASIMFDYGRLWTDVGGERRGRHYRVPFETQQKPLSQISLSHRARTRRKREAKRLISQSIALRLRTLIRAPKTAVAANFVRRLAQPELAQSLTSASSQRA